jgi:hypothetical protein
MRISTKLKHNAIIDTFNKLHNEQRLRHDDVIAEIMAIYFIESARTIDRILEKGKYDLPAPSATTNQ